MSPTTPDVLAALRQRRRSVIQGFLWTLLGVVVVTLLLNGLLLGSRALSLPALAPNLTFCALIGTALWLNHHHRFTAALGLILVLTLGTGALQILFTGIEGAQLVLYLFFIPVLLAGLLLDRRALYLTGGTGLAVVLGTLALQRAGLHPRALVAPDAATAFALQFAIIFTLAVFFLDRFGLSLNRALATAAEREVALAQEVAERRQAEEEVRRCKLRIENLNEGLEERLERAVALHEIDHAITSSRSLDATLDAALAQVRACQKVDAASVLLYAPADQSLRFAAAQGFRGSRLRGTSLQLGEGLAGRAALQREPVVVEGREAFARSFDGTRLVEGEDVEAYVAMPLVAKGELQGVLELFHRAPLEQDDDWFAFLHTLAAQIAIALDNACLFQDLERANDKLQLAYNTTIEGWARTLDLRDAITEHHSRRVTKLTLELGRRMGLSDTELEHAWRGALLHDIGKIGVPDSILLKPGELDEEEWAVMKRHPTFAFDLLSPIEFLRPALDIPYAHHEKWDGSGYPRGLEGTQIPLAARLFAVVDVYDALTSDRPYRAAWSEAGALDLIREQRGTHFDPAAVDAFLDYMQNGRSST